MDYQINLLRAALNHSTKYDYIFMLSGFDYPLWSNAKITKYLEDNYGCEYLKGIAVQSTYYLRDLQREVRPDFDPKWLPASCGRIIRGGLRKMAKLLRIRKPKVLRTSTGEIYDVYKGSDYFCITSELAQYVVDKYDSDKRIRRYFRHTFAPSETVIHTIAFNSPYKSKCILALGPYEGLASLTPLHYINGCHIKILCTEDFDQLINSGKMFARKFRSGISEELISLLEAYKCKVELI